jgi:hypothetical protein
LGNTCVAGVQKLRLERLEIDARVAALFRQGRHNGIDRKVIKEVLGELHGEADAETVWRLYAAKLGITDADIADGDNPLDKILGPQTGI